MNKCFSVLRLGTCMPWSVVSWAFSDLTVWFMISAYGRKCTSCIPRGSCFHVFFARGIDSVGTREFGVGLPGRLEYQTRYQKEVLESEDDRNDSDDGGDDSKCIFPCGPDAHDDVWNGKSVSTPPHDTDIPLHCRIILTNTELPTVPKGSQE